MSDAGFNVVLLETRQVKGALKAMPLKTDRRDAEGIARLLQMGWFRPDHCKSVSAQEMRAVLSTRKSLQQSLINLELSLRGVLRNFGLKMGAVSKLRFEARVRELVDGNLMLERATDPSCAPARNCAKNSPGSRSCCVIWPKRILTAG
ncbi:MAG TPA: transposase [Paracoccus sp.]|nr:transposase [Paracoccus sp. (in: a-proteobacteria)]